MSSAQQLVIGVDVGGTNMQFGVVDATGTIIGRTASRTGAAEGPDHILDAIHDGIQSCITAAGASREDIDAVGIVIAGAIDRSSGMILDAPNLGLSEFSICKLLSDRLLLPVVIENDVNGALLGEIHFGTHEPASHALGIWIGTGVGGAIIMNGELYHGPLDTAAEIGQTVLFPDEEPGFRTVEQQCGRAGIRKVIGRMLHEYPASLLHELHHGDVSQLDTNDLKSAYDAGDPLLLSVIDQSADLIGTVISTHVTMLAIDLVIIGGGITETFGSTYLDRIRKRFNRDVFPSRPDRYRLAITTLAADAGLLGGAFLARKSTSTTP